jgi:hypothetical protein
MTRPTFTKTEGTRRVHKMIRAQKWQTRGRKIEIQYNGQTPGGPDGHTYPLCAGLDPAHLAHGATFRVLLSTLGEWAELRDLFTMNIGTPQTPPHLHDKPTPNTETEQP